MGRRRGRSIEIGRAPTAHAGRVPKDRRATCPRRPSGRRSPSCARRLANARTLIVSEYRGLKVKEIAEIRRALRKQDVTYRVVKNRLMRIAAEDSVGEALSPLLVGPTAIAFGTDEAGTAKAVLDATRPYARVVRITGGVLGDQAIGAEDVTRLAALPSREVLLAKLAGGMQAPVGTLAGLLRRPAAQPGLRPAAGRRPEGRRPGRLAPLTDPPTRPRPHEGDHPWQP